MTEVLERDVSGKCDDCEDRVKQGEKERQEKMKDVKAENPDQYPEAPGAKSRNEPPGALGGKV